MGYCTVAIYLFCIIIRDQKLYIWGRADHIFSSGEKKKMGRWFLLTLSQLGYSNSFATGSGMVR